MLTVASGLGSLHAAPRCPFQVPRHQAVAHVTPGSSSFRTRSASKSRRATRVATSASYRDSNGPGYMAKYEKNGPDFTHLMAVGLFVAVKYGGAAFSTSTVLLAMAYLQLLQAAITLVLGSHTKDTVSDVITPAVLAMYALNFQSVSPFGAMVGLFGVDLCQRATDSPVWKWVWFGTLAAAFYYNYGSIWYTTAFTLLALLRLQRQASNDWGMLPWLTALPVVVVSGYVAYRQVFVPWAVLLFMAQIFWSGLRIVGGLVRGSAAPSSTASTV